MSLNVNRQVQDAFYRYKMPRLQAKVEGKGNGVKTVIPNMVDIARALGRPPTYPTKYFGCELGAQTQFDFKNDRYIVNGSHDAPKLQDMLDGFIRKFVLCENCDNPETDIKVNAKKQTLGATCKACGHSFPLDMRHKLATFILRNPPEQKLNTQGTSLTKRKDKRSKQGNDDNEETNGNGHNNETFGDGGDDEENVTWATDVSEDAVRERMTELSLGVKALAVDDDIEKSEPEKLNILFTFAKKALDKGKLEIQDEKEIMVEAERLEVTNKAPMLMCELIFDGKILTQIKTYKRLLLRFTNENTKAQKYLMGGIEKTIETHKDVLLPKVAHILKSFYDEDIIDEEVILEWGKKVSKKYVSKELSEQIHKKAEPFLKWLKEAEEESDEEDDSDGAIDLEFDERAKISTIKEVEENKNGKETSPASKDDDNDDDEDEIDIDDI